jgi:serine/threonine protein kinase
MREPSPGLLIGIYRLEEPLGHGGMGTVFRAIDTKLNRPVAIKFLSEDLADATARRRFQREAQLASSLNHPHILTVFDAGEHEDRQYLVTEFVDGGTLRDWAKHHRHNWREAVELLTGVADGLAAAHAAGMTHRDIKPANILLTKSGYAKLADFGLAKLLVEGAESDATATMTEGRTRPGTVIGTVAYMSPEQASGRPTDARSDVFSFGIVLFEMIEGRRPFTASNELELLKTIIHGESAPITVAVPAGLRSVVAKTLEKDPDKRYRSARELVAALRPLVRSKEAETALPPTVTMHRAPAISRRTWLIVAGLITSTLAATTYWRLDRQDYFWNNPLDNPSITRLTDWPEVEFDAAISHDGKFVTFLSNRDGFYDSWVTQLNSGIFHNLTGGKTTTLLHEMTRSTGFNADATQIWLRTPAPILGTIAASIRPTLSLVPTFGGDLRPFLRKLTLNPVWTPDGSRLLFHHATEGDPVVTVDPKDDANEKELVRGRVGEHQHYVNWSPDAKWIYFVRSWRSLEGDIWRIPAAGGVAEQITHHNSHVAYPVFFDPNTLVYRASKEDGSGWALFAMDVNHRIPHQITQGVEEYQSVSVSADGKRLAVTVSNPVANVWKVPLKADMSLESDVAQVPVPASHVTYARYVDGGVLYLAGKGGANGLWKWRDGKAVSVVPARSGRIVYAAVPSPDTIRLAYVVRTQGRNALQVAAADGSNPQALAAGLDLLNSPTWSPDGQWLAVAAATPDGPRLFKISSGGGTPVKLTNVPSYAPVWSPAGDRIVFYDGTVGGSTFDIAMVTPDGQMLKVLPLLHDGQSERLGYHGEYEGYRFTPDGKNLVILLGQFRAMDFWQVELATGKGRQLTKLKQGYSVRNFDITPDGKELLFDRVQENSDIVIMDRR